MIPGSLAMMGGEVVASTYRYLRFYQTANVGASNDAYLYELDYSADAGSTWVPSSAMTSNSAPSPLVASADVESGTELAWKAFDNTINYTAWNTGNAVAHPHWVKIDLGAGNGILPNRVRFVNYNSSGTDFTPKDFTIQGSNTGSFSGEQVTLLTVTGALTQPHQTTITYTI